MGGSWRAYKTDRSSNGPTIKYRFTPEGFSGEAPLGERFNRKFTDAFYPVEDDRGHTLAAAKVTEPHTVELTHQRKDNDKTVSVSRMWVTSRRQDPPGCLRE